MNIRNKYFISRTLLMEEEKEELKAGDKYQWIKGDNFGVIEIVEKSNESKIFFESGRVIMTAVLEEYMIDINSKTPIIVQSKENLDKIKTESPAVVAVNTPPEKKEDIKPEPTLLLQKVGKALDKSKITNKIKVEIDLKLLDTSLYDFLKETEDDFENVYMSLLKEQFNTKIEKLIKSQLTPNKNE